MRSFGFASLLPLLFVMACGDESAPVTAPTTAGPSAPQAGPADDAPVETAPIEWKRCSLVTDEDDGRAQCANVEVPLDWNAPDGKKVTVFVKRLLGNAKGAKQQVWLLQGGPGGAGDGLEGIAEEIAAKDDKVDIYIPDHRGTGRSAYLDCPATRKSSGRADFDYAACAQEATNIWGADGLATFTTTTAARDVGYVIEKTREPDQRVHVYGVSYGTYWAQRYLQLFPNQPTAVTLDSVCQSGICSLSKMGYWFDVVAKKYLGECAQDAFCAEKMGADPVAKVKGAIERADAGTCAGISGVDGAMLRQLYQWFITSVELRVMIPSTAYRIMRCNDDDVDALKTFVSNLQSMFGGGFKGFATHDLSSDVLGIHIALSELEASPPPTAAQLAELMKDSVIAKPDTHMIDAYQIWPRYPHDQWVDKYPESSVPVLLLNGTLDPQTPLEFAEQIAPHYTKAHQALVRFPRAAHATIHQSPIEGENPGFPACGMLVWKDFVADPNAALDTSCTQNIRGHHFEDGLGIAKWMYDRSSLWDDAPAPGASTPTRPPPLSYAKSKAIENELRRAERDSRVLRLGDRLRVSAL